jgi:NDP-sugar pyrophosphorylase family protein
MPKNRLTITLAPDILEKVDQLIDKKTIRNRSHAIEYLVTNSLRPVITTAVILAGKNTPDSIRPLTEIQGKPLIAHTIAHLKQYGVEQIIVATDQVGQQIESAIGDGSSFDLSIKYVYEDQPLGTAGAIKHLADYLDHQPFFVWSGDVLTDINLDDLTEFHTKHQAVVTFAVKPRATHQSYDNVFLQGPRVVDFKPSTSEQQVSIVNTGVYVFDPEILASIGPNHSMLERDVFPGLTKAGKCVAFLFQGMWFDITSDTNYKKLLKGRNYEL